MLNCNLNSGSIYITFTFVLYWVINLCNRKRKEKEKVENCLILWKKVSTQKQSSKSLYTHTMRCTYTYKKVNRL